MGHRAEGKEHRVGRRQYAVGMERLTIDDFRLIIDYCTESAGKKVNNSTTQ